MEDRNKVYTISPSDLTYICYHCEYLKKNYELYNSGVSAGVTTTLDGIEKKYFLGDCKKISQDLPEGEVFDPYNIYFHSKLLRDNKNREFRIKGKCDALIKFLDKSSGIIDFKTSKFENKKDVKKNKSYDEELKKKVEEYSPQLHAYSLLYSNLETDEKFLAEKSTATTEKTKKESVKKKLEKIKKVSIKEVKILGLVFIYPDDIIEGNHLNIHFSYKYVPIFIDMKNFKNLITKYIDNLYLKEPLSIPDSCGLKGGYEKKKCLMHKYFYDVKKLKDLDKVN
jgi:hypothetical protein